MHSAAVVAFGFLLTAPTVAHAQIISPFGELCPKSKPGVSCHGKLRLNVGSYDFKFQQNGCKQEGKQYSGDYINGTGFSVGDTSLSVPILAGMNARGYFNIIRAMQPLLLLKKCICSHQTDCTTSSPGPTG